MFGTQAGLDDLENKDWVCDGTFKCSPHIYYQLFTLRIVIWNISRSCLFVLQPSKSQITYRRLFTTLKDLHPSLEREILMAYFERAIINAFCYTFSTTNITCCLWYLSPYCRYRFKVWLSNRRRIEQHIKCFTALVLLPAHDVINGFLELTDDVNFSPMICILFWNSLYRKRTQTNAFERNQKNRMRTNNRVDGFRNATENPITSIHPNLWKLIS